MRVERKRTSARPASEGCLAVARRAEADGRGVCGELAQLGERLVCNQEVTGSSPVFSTSLRSAACDNAELRLGRRVGGSVSREGWWSLAEAAEGSEGGPQPGQETFRSLTTEYPAEGSF